MSKNIKYTKYIVNGIEFGDLQTAALASYVKEQIDITDNVVNVLQETTTYNVHNTKPVKLLKSQVPPKKRNMRVYNGLHYRSISFDQFYEMINRSVNQDNCR
jgi:hypothetical protein